MKIFFLFIVLILPKNGISQTEVDSKKTEQLEFDGTVVEGMGGGFGGITAVKTKQNSGSLYSKHIDFGKKIHESVTEMNSLKLVSPVGEKP